MAAIIVTVCCCGDRRTMKLLASAFVFLGIALNVELGEDRGVRGDHRIQAINWNEPNVSCST